MADFDVAVVCAPFQPPSRLHGEAIAAAAEAAPCVVVLCHGANAAPSPRTPWSSAERETLVREAFGALAPLSVVHVQDVRYDAGAWAAAAARAVTAAVPGAHRVGVLGDDAPAALPVPEAWTRATPAWPLLAAEADARTRLLWPATSGVPDAPALPPAVQAAVEAREATGGFDALREETAFLGAFRASWAQAPYPPVFVTVDALVTWRDRVLLVRRGRAPGRGLWAMPGGFVDVGEPLADAASRELEEETGLALGPPAAPARVFDAPERSLRGRTITHVFRYACDGAAPPRLRAGDDAAAAEWRPLAALGPADLFEDHWSILEVMLSAAPG